VSGALRPRAARIVAVRGGLVMLVLMALALGAASADAGTRVIPPVTLIGDSVPDALVNDDRARAILEQGIDLDTEVAVCRRVDGQSCPDGTVTPPNVVDLVTAMGPKLGPNVVVCVGYNDFEDQYAQNIENALAALRAAGVKRVWWLTLRAAHHGYLTMNDDIEAAAQRHPELSVIDWNVYSRSHPDWFQDDGLHLLSKGSEAMATLIHERLLRDGVALKPVRMLTRRLPVAHPAKSYHARLTATAGDAPYRFMLLAHAPRGIHLEASGSIVGRPRVAPGAYVLEVRVLDSANSFDTRRLTLRVTS
jgi:putative Ig domain-containing protein